MSEPDPPRAATGVGSKPRGKTRSLLLETGMQLFARKGFDGVAISELEEAVGLKAGSGSFYRHFADKEALLEAIIKQEIDRARQRRAREQHAINDPDTDIRQALAEQFRLTLAGLRQNAELINLIGRSAGHFPKLMQELRKQLVKQAAVAVAEGFARRIERGEMRNADPNALAAVVQSALFGYFSAEAVFGKAVNPQEAEDALVNTLVTMLVSTPSAPA